VSPIHIHASPEDVAPYVLLPGDPGRARFVAETYLENARLYNEHRGLLGFTGTYKGLPVSVQTTGMGTPSAAIVTEELVQLGAKRLVRIGTAGALAPGVHPGDLVVAQSAIPFDGTTRQYLKGRPFAPTPSYPLMRALIESAGEGPVHIGPILTEDAFYATKPEDAKEWAAYGALAVEMESAAIFLLARMRGIEAATVLAVSNYVGDPQMVPDEILSKAVDRVVRTALEALVRLEGKA